MICKKGTSTSDVVYQISKLFPDLSGIQIYYYVYSFCNFTSSLYPSLPFVVTSYYRDCFLLSLSLSFCRRHAPSGLEHSLIMNIFLKYTHFENSNLVSKFWSGIVITKLFIPFVANNACNSSDTYSVRYKVTESTITYQKDSQCRKIYGKVEKENGVNSNSRNHEILNI